MAGGRSLPLGEEDVLGGSHACMPPQWHLLESTWNMESKCALQPTAAGCSLPACSRCPEPSPWGRVAWDGSLGMLARTALLSPECLPWRLAVTSDIHMAAPVCRESRGSRADGGLMENFGGHPPALFWRFVHDQPQFSLLGGLF